METFFTACPLSFFYSFGPFDETRLKGLCLFLGYVVLRVVALVLGFLSLADLASSNLEEDTYCPNNFFLNY